MQVSREMTLTVGGTGSIGLAVGTVPVGTAVMPFNFEEPHSSTSADCRSVQDGGERDASAEQNQSEILTSEVIAAEKLALLALYF